MTPSPHSGGNTPRVSLREFGLIFRIVAVPTLYITAPWRWSVPWYEAFGGAAAGVFLAAVTTYATFYVTTLVAFSGFVRIGTIVVSCVVYVGGGVIMIELFTGPRQHIANLGVFCLLLFTLITYRILRKSEVRMKRTESANRSRVSSNLGNEAEGTRGKEGVGLGYAISSKC